MDSITMQDQKKFTFSKGDTTTLAEFDDLFSELFNRTWVVFGEEYNLSDLGWKRDYHRRKRALGTCKYQFRKERYYNVYSYKLRKPGTVYISMELLSRNLDKAYDFEDTIRHEIAHAIHAQIDGKSNHDARWKRIASEVGADPTRLHEGFLEKPQGKYTVICPNCETESPRYRKPKHEMACGKCCDKYNNGKFSRSFLLEYKQNY